MTRIPPAPLLLGLAGLIPFLWGAASTLSPDLQVWGTTRLGPGLVGPFVQLSYGIVILSFMSGVLWGFATKADGAQAAPRFKLTPVCPGVAGAEANREFGIVGFEVDRQAGMVWMWWQAFDARGMPRDSGRDALAACTVVDAMNWRCGGQTRTFSRLTSVGEAHAMEDGHYRYTPTHPPSADAARRCRVRVSPH